MVLPFYATGRAMKTTVEVPDDLYRRAKSEAAPRGVGCSQFPTLDYQRSSRTHVGDLKCFKRIGILSPLVHVARKLRTKS
jgi:hypothetical protein